MKARYLFLCFILFHLANSKNIEAQSIGMNGSGAAPDSTAMLDVSSSNKGLLIPRVYLTSSSDASTIPSASNSLLVYNTNTSIGAGFYYNSGTNASINWTKLNTEGTDWKMTGNAGTNSSTDYIGTSDAEPLIIRTDATQRVSISETGTTIIGTSSNNSTIDPDGSLTFHGTATIWDDLFFPFTKAENNNMTFDNTTVTLTFPSRDVSKEIYIVAQLPHCWKEGSAIFPHIHWQQNFANPTPPNYINFVMLYKWFNIGDPIPGSWTTLNTTDATGTQYLKTYTSGNLHQISSWPSISGTGKTISSMLLIKVYRYDPTTGTSSNLPGFQFDIHYEKDAIGSHQTYVK